MNRYQMAYDFLKTQAPCIIDYPEADGMAVIAVMPSGNTYGVEYSHPFISLEEMYRNEDEQILNMFAGHIQAGKDADFKEFLAFYKQEAQQCNTEYKQQFIKNVALFEQEISQL